MTKILQPFAVQIKNKKQSEAIQKMAFRCGYQWWGRLSPFELSTTSYTYLQFNTQLKSIHGVQGDIPPDPECDVVKANSNKELEARALIFFNDPPYNLLLNDYICIMHDGRIEINGMTISSVQFDELVDQYRAEGW